MLTCEPWVKIISIRGVRFRFWCWTRLSMLKKVPELAWTTVNFYSSWESVFLTSGIKLNTKKRSLCPVNCAHLVWFCQLLKLVSTVFHFPRVRGVLLRSILRVIIPLGVIILLVTLFEVPIWSSVFLDLDQRKVLWFQKKSSRTDVTYAEVTIKRPKTCILIS